MVLPKSMSKPDPRVMSKLKRVFRYLKGTVSIGITYSEDAGDGDKLTAYVDSDHAGDQERDTLLLELFVLSRWTCGLEVANRGGHLYGRSRIRRHVQGVFDDLTLSELVGID